MLSTNEDTIRIYIEQCFNGQNKVLNEKNIFLKFIKEDIRMTNKHEKIFNIISH